MATVTTTTATTTTATTPPMSDDPPPPLAAGLARWTPSIPTNLISMLNPFAVASDSMQKTDKPASEAGEHTSTSRGLKKRPILEPLTGGALASRSSSPARSTATSAMFDEPDARSTSEEGSVDGKERLRRNVRPKTRYSICQAPPASSTRQKLHRRPRALLQLHKLSSTARPRPAYEVIPSANFSVRLNRAISKVFTARHSLCQSDLVVLQAENYNVEEEDEEEEMRDVIGLICKGRKDDERNGGGRARIYLASGREWEAYTTMGGAYEFLSTDEHGLGLTVRWVPKRTKDASKAAGRDGARKFNFSTISPNSRRHPVIATLSKTGLDINDTYKMPDPAAATPLSTPQQAGSALAEAMEEEGERELCETDDQLREIITITSIWVAFKEGWSPAFKYDDKDGFLTPASPTKSLASPTGTPPASPGQFTMEKRRSIQSISSGIIRRTSVLSKRNSSMSTTAADDDEQPHAQSAAATSGSVRSSRARADSSSTVLVQRAASNRRKNQQHQNHPQQRKGLADLLAAHNQLQEVSREDLPTRDGGGSGGGGGSNSSGDLAPQHPAAAPSSDEGGSRSPTPALLSAADAHRAEKRGSTTTSDTSAFLEPPAQQHGKQKKIRKSGSWRRLLCGSSQEQM